MWRVVLFVCVFVSKCGVCVSRVVWHAEKPPCVDSTRLRVYIQNVPVYASNTRTRFSTCARVAGTHGDVLNLHTGSVLSLHTGVITSSAYQEKPMKSSHWFTKSNQWM